MKRVAEDGDWTLFSPDETPDLHDLTGQAFEVVYTAYEARAERGDMKVSKNSRPWTCGARCWPCCSRPATPGSPSRTPATCVTPTSTWARCIAPTSAPRSPCTPTTRNRRVQPGSVNLAAHVGPDGIDHAKLKRTVTTAMRMLDNVIDYNFYTSPARKSNLRHRPVGLGIMASRMPSTNCASPTQPEAVEFAI